MRSTRKKPEDVAKEYISSTQDPSGYSVQIIPPKGRGIITETRRSKGEFLLCYYGDLITGMEGEELEDTRPSTFRYFFSWQQKKWCVDATEETNKFGRLVNHGRRERNSVMKIIECKGKPYLCLFATRDILPKEEILYDYGISNLPWESGSKTNRFIDFKFQHFQFIQADEVPEQIIAETSEEPGHIPAEVSEKPGQPLAEQLLAKVLGDPRQILAEVSEESGGICGEVSDEPRHIPAEVSEKPGQPLAELSEKPGQPLAELSEKPGGICGKVSDEPRHIPAEVSEKPGEPLAELSEKPGQPLAELSEKPGGICGEVSDEPRHIPAEVSEKPGQPLAELSEKPGQPLAELSEKPGQLLANLSEVSEEPVGICGEVSDESRHIPAEVSEKPGQPLAELSEKPGQPLAELSEKPGQLLANLSEVSEEPGGICGEVSDEPRHIPAEVSEKPGQPLAELSEKPGQPLADLSEKPGQLLANLAEVSEEPGGICGEVSDEPRHIPAEVSEKPGQPLAELSEKPGQLLANVLGDPRQILAEVSEEPGGICGEVSDEPRHVLAEFSEKAGQILTKVSEEPGQILAIVLVDPRQILAEVSEGPGQILADVSEGPGQILAEVSEEPGQMFAEVSKEPGPILVELSIEPGQILAADVSKQHTAKGLDFPDEDPYQHFPAVSEEAWQILDEVSEEPGHMFAEVSKEPGQILVELSIKPGQILAADVSKQHTAKGLDFPDSTEYVSESDCDSGSSDIYPFLNGRKDDGGRSFSNLVQENVVSSSVQEVSKDRKGKHDYQKLHACLYCERLDLKISRHLVTHHSNEVEIANLPSVSKNRQSKAHKEREKQLDALRNMGNFLHNVQQLQKTGKVSLIVARRPEGGKHNSGDYLPCKFCLRFYLKSELWRHCKSCSFMENPLNANVDENKGVKHFKKAGQLLLQGASGTSSTNKQKIDFQHYIVNSLSDDEVSREVLHDNSLLELGKSLFEKLGKERSSEVRYRLRLLARVKLEIKKDQSAEGGNDMDSYIAPQNFNQFVECTKRLVGVCDERSLNGVIMFQRPETAKKIGQLLKKLANFKMGKAIKDRNPGARQDALDFISLYEVEWIDKISSIAHQTSKERRFNKKEMLPITEDLIKLQKFLETKVEECTGFLSEEKTMANWRDLARVLLCKVQTFNFRRGNEASKMLVAKFLERANWRQCNTEISNTLQSLEKEIAKRMDLVEVIGKQNRKVPILLTPSVKSGINLLVATREEVGIQVDNPYVFAKGEGTFIRGADALKFVVHQVDLKHPEYIKFPKMRKYLATVVQVFGLKEIELNEVARHMGHELNVHRQYYRLQDDVTELAKISKLLLAVEKGVAHKFSGLSLDDIEIDGIPNVEADEDTEEDGDASSVFSFMDTDTKDQDQPLKRQAVESPAYEPKSKRKATLKALDVKKMDEPGCSSGDEYMPSDDGLEDDSADEEKDLKKRKTGKQTSTLNANMKRRKTAVQRKVWTDEELTILQELIKKSIKECKPPVKKDILDIQNKNDILKKTPWLKIKYQIWSKAQQGISKTNQTIKNFMRK